MKKKVLLDLQGQCLRRQLDIAKIKEYLILNDYEIVNTVEDSDIVLFFGCAFNSYQEEKNLGLIDKYKKCNLYVLEGLAKVAKEKLIKKGIPEKNIISLDQTEALDLVFSKNIVFSKMKERNQVKKESIFSIMVAHGCNDTCSYCGDKKIVGNLISKPIPKIINEITDGLSKGYDFFRLLGDDVGAYGIDMGLTIFDLLTKINQLPEKFHLDMQEVNIKYLIKNLASFENFCKSGRLKHITVAFQSGNNRVLQLMNRGYQKEDILELIKILKKYSVDFHYHAMVGFPSETSLEFEDTIDILKAYVFNSCSIFKYQERHYTKAFDIAPKISPAEVERRLKNLEIQLENRFEYIRLPDKLQIRKIR